MPQHDKKREEPAHQQGKSVPGSQKQQQGQEGVNPSGNQDQFNIEGMQGQYGSSRDQPGPFNSEDLYKTSSQGAPTQQDQEPSHEQERK